MNSQGIIEIFKTNVTQNYAQFAGRASRAEFWLFVLAQVIITFVFFLLGIGAAGLGVLLHSDTVTNDGLITVVVLYLLYRIALIVPDLAVSVRRLHDTGKSGWWYLICLVPYVGGLVLFIFFILDSQPGPNQWGPHPYGLGNMMPPYTPPPGPPPGSWPPPPQGGG
jgi:uncharacterized membrane protein YhaH (DUF805 family)